MAVPPTVSIGPASETRVSAPEFRERPRASEVASSTYQSPNSAKEVAEWADVRPDFAKVSREDHYRLKSEIARLGKILQKIQARLRLKNIRWSGEGKGVTQSAEELISLLESKRLGDLAEELRGELEKYQSIKRELEAKLSGEKPQVSPARMNSEVALKILSRYAGGADQEALKDPIKLRTLVFKNLRSKLKNIQEASKKVRLEKTKWEGIWQTGTVEEKEKAEKVLAVLRSQAQQLARITRVVEQAMRQAEVSLRVIEGEELQNELVGQETETEGEVAPSGDPGPENVSVQTASRQAVSQGATVGIASVGGYEEGVSEYIEIQGSGETQAQTGGAAIQSVDLTGTNLAVIQSAGRSRQEHQKTKRVLDQLMKRLQAGDYRVLELCFILVAHQLSWSTTEVAAKVVKALDALDRSQKGIVDMLNGVNVNDPSFSSKTAAANIQANRIAADRVTATNLLRDMVTSMEEAQNVAKSFLDIQGNQTRQLSRFTS